MNTDKLTSLRFVPLVLCLLVAVGMGASLWLSVVESLALASVRTGMALLWISGPFLLAIALAMLVRRGAERIVFDLALVTITVVDFGALALSLLPFLTARGLFTFLPFFQFAGLTALLVLVLLGRRWIPELAKRFRSGTLEEL